jgi:NAD(P)-dependent dehydrogenase (short-subunit alcohol dehydrogenase family)
MRSHGVLNLLLECELKNTMEYEVARLNGTRAIITGGAGAIGMATARAFLREGAKVVIADMDTETVAKASAALGAPGRAYGLTVDVTSAVDVQRMVDEAAALMDGISALINNAGTVARAPLAEMPEADIDRQIDVNLKGVVLCTRAVIPHLRGVTNASITSTSSQAGKRGWAEIAVYGASKAAVIGFSRCMAVELAPAIRVNSICPGHIGEEGMAWRGFDTRKSSDASTASFGDAFARENIPLQRLQGADDIAAGFVYLTALESKEITGVALGIGGGVAMD